MNRMILEKMHPFRGAPSGCHPLLPGSEKIPSIAGYVHEDRDSPVSLHTRLGDELDTSCHHPLVGRVEVLDSEKEADSSRDLIPDHLWKELALIGNAEEVGERVKQTLERHPEISHFVINPPVAGAGLTYESIMTEFATKVIPYATAKLAN